MIHGLNLTRFFVSVVDDQQLEITITVGRRRPETRCGILPTLIELTNCRWTRIFKLRDWWCRATCAPQIGWIGTAGPCCRLSPGNFHTDGSYSREIVLFNLHGVDAPRSRSTTSEQDFPDLHTVSLPGLPILLSSVLLQNDNATTLMGQEDR